METLSNVSLKLLIDNKNHKVLFAEAGKDFVDFLFNLMSLPLGTVVRLISKESMLGCLGNLYESIENLDQTYLQPNQNKELILKLKPVSPSPSSVRFYEPINYTEVSGPKEGFVKGVVTYMVMDNLEVMPMSTISSITFLNKFNVKDISALEERVVRVGKDEGVQLLEESLQTNAVLTSVFLGNKTVPPDGLSGHARA